MTNSHFSQNIEWIIKKTYNLNVLKEAQEKLAAASIQHNEDQEI